MKKIVITGGVLTPALALIEELKKGKNWEIYYLGRERSLEGSKTLSAESQVIPKTGAHFFAFNPGRIQRHFTRHTIPSFLRIPFGFFQAWRFLDRIRPDIIISFGGYVSVPVVLAGWFKRIPIVTHEQTVVFGLASRFNSFFADKICLSFAQSLPYFPAEKTVLTGNPLREEIFFIRKPDWFSGPLDRPLIYLTGGNQGSVTLNKTFVKIVDRLLEFCLVIHQTGETDFKNIIKEKEKLTVDKQKNYFVLPFVENQDIGWVLNKASLVIARAGANTVCELAVLGKPAILVPIPWAFQDEQTKNAKMLQEAGTAQIINQNELTSSQLLTAIEEMLKNLSCYQANSPRAKKLIIPHAAKNLLKVIYELV